MIIEIDGNDGVGKTTYIKRLQEIFPKDIFFDRGALSKATLHELWESEQPIYKEMIELNSNICYILLDTYVEQSQERILKRGDRIDVPYHNIDDLIKYQYRFHVLATSNKQRFIPMYATYNDFNQNISLITNYINGFKQAKNKDMKLIIGTSNKGKIREIASILSSLDLDLETQVIDVDEIGKTIEENSYIKALAYSKANPDSLVLCDDSGLVVPALNGLPGAYSARFHSIELDNNLNVINVPKEDFTTDKRPHDKLNNERLLALIKSIPFSDRNAYFEVCFTLMLNGEVLFSSSKKSYGFISDEMKGDNGFGYDPLFIGDDTFGKTYAELDSARKNMRSHRKTALNEIAEFLSNYFK